MKVLAVVFLFFPLAGCGEDDVTGTGDPVDDVDYALITTIDYAEHVQPIFDQKCSDSGCHAGTSPAFGLGLDSWESVMAGSDGGEVVIPYDAERSLLAEIYRGEATPHSVGADSLKTTLRDFLDRWIDEGARSEAGVVYGADATK
ncbi:MAG: hypothetical protein KAI64_01590, partial [Thermoplasmata archaeon]|nr:hypothetical protein [Thermoplasmata archaeon]